MLIFGFLFSTPSITIKIQCRDNEISVPFNLTQLQTIRDTRIHQLFAKKKADSISSTAKGEISAVKNLCKKYTVLSNLTSFILVEQRNRVKCHTGARKYSACETSISCKNHRDANRQQWLSYIWRKIFKWIQSYNWRRFCILQHQTGQQRSQSATLGSL